MLSAHDSQASPDEATMGTASEPDRASTRRSDAFGVNAEFDSARMTLAVKGELDLVSAPALEREIEALPWPELAELVFDLAEVTFIDSSGLHVLVRAAQRAAMARVRFSVVNVPEHPQKLFTLVGLTDSLNVQP